MKIAMFKKKSLQVSIYEEPNTRSHLGMETITTVYRTAITSEIKRKQTIHTHSLAEAIQFLSLITTANCPYAETQRGKFKE